MINIPSIIKFPKRVHEKAFITLVLGIGLSLLGWFSIDLITIFSVIVTITSIFIITALYTLLCWMFVTKEELLDIKNSTKKKD